MDCHGNSEEEGSSSHPKGSENFGQKYILWDSAWRMDSVKPDGRPQGQTSHKLNDGHLSGSTSHSLWLKNSPILAERRIEKGGMEKERVWENKEMDACQKEKREIEKWKNTVALEPTYLLHTENPQSFYSKPSSRKSPPCFPISHFLLTPQTTAIWHCPCYSIWTFLIKVPYTRFPIGWFHLAWLFWVIHLVSSTTTVNATYIPWVLTMWGQFSPPKFIYPCLIQTVVVSIELEQVLLTSVSRDLEQYKTSCDRQDGLTSQWFTWLKMPVVPKLRKHFRVCFGCVTPKVPMEKAWSLVWNYLEEGSSGGWLGQIGAMLPGRLM